MPEPTDKATTERAEALEQELDKARADARQEVATETAEQERERAREERIANLERQISELRPSTPVEPVAAAPVVAAPPADDGKIDALTEKVDALAEKVTEPIEDVAGAVMEPIEDAAEDAEEVVESLPKRTHGLFRPIFGKHRE